MIVTRAAPNSANATLAWLMLSDGDLNPAFDEYTQTYSALVPLSVDEITVTPFVSDSGATVQVNGNDATHGAPSDPLPPNPGTTTITILVTAQNGTGTIAYSANVQQASSNADLSSLYPSSGSPSPTFNADTCSCTVSVPCAASQICFGVYVAGVGATVTMNGTPVSGSSRSIGYIDLCVGTNPDVVTIAVTAEDGIATKTCVTSREDGRPPSPPATLAERRRGGVRHGTGGIRA